MKSSIQIIVLLLIALPLVSCASTTGIEAQPIANTQAGFEYLKALEGKWTVDGGDEGTSAGNSNSRPEMVLSSNVLRLGLPRK